MPYQFLVLDQVLGNQYLALGFFAVSFFDLLFPSLLHFPFFCSFLPFSLWIYLCYLYSPTQTNKQKFQLDLRFIIYKAYSKTSLWLLLPLLTSYCFIFHKMTISSYYSIDAAFSRITGVLILNLVDFNPYSLWTRLTIPSFKSCAFSGMLSSLQLTFIGMCIMNQVKLFLVCEYYLCSRAIFRHCVFLELDILLTSIYSLCLAAITTGAASITTVTVFTIIYRTE